jgi:hypothetical protein
VNAIPQRSLNVEEATIFVKQNLRLPFAMHLKPGPRQDLRIWVGLHGLPPLIFLPPAHRPLQPLLHPSEFVAENVGMVKRKHRHLLHNGGYYKGQANSSSSQIHRFCLSAGLLRWLLNLPKIQAQLANLCLPPYNPAPDSK